MNFNLFAQSLNVSMCLVRHFDLSTMVFSLHFDPRVLFTFGLALSCGSCDGVNAEPSGESSTSHWEITIATDLPFISSIRSSSSSAIVFPSFLSSFSPPKSVWIPDARLFKSIKK